MYVCLGITCHLHLWQNDRGLLRATAVTQGWNGHRIKSQHIKLTLEKKILPPLLPGFELRTLRSRVRRYPGSLRAIPLRITDTACNVAQCTWDLSEENLCFIGFHYVRSSRLGRATTETWRGKKAETECQVGVTAIHKKRADNEKRDF